MSQLHWIYRCTSTYRHCGYSEPGIKFPDRCPECLSPAIRTFLVPGDKVLIKRGGQWVVLERDPKYRLAIEEELYRRAFVPFLFREVLA